MKVCPLLCRSFALILAAPLHGCHQTLPDLPSHPASEMFPRASSPPPTCPGQYRMMLEDAKGGYFMGCWGRKTD